MKSDEKLFIHFGWIQEEYEAMLEAEKQGKSIRDIPEEKSIRWKLEQLGAR